MLLSELPNEVIGAILKTLLLEIGIRKAIVLRGVCKLFAHHTDEAIFSLPTFEDADDLSPAHCRQDPRMSKATISRLILRKMTSGSAESRSLVHEIQSTIHFLRPYCMLGNKELAQALASACSEILPLRDISRGLAQGSYQGSCQTLLENSLLAAIYLDEGGLCDIALELGAKVTTWTRFFGDSISAAARKGRDQILRKLLDHQRSFESATTAQLFRERQIAALDEAAANGHEGTVLVMLDKGDSGLTQGNAINHAIRAALLSFQENTARTLALRGRGNITYDTDLLRAAAVGNSIFFLQATLDDAEAVGTKLSLDFALEDASRSGHLLATRFLLSRYDRHNLMSWSGAFFWAARQGYPEILDLLFSNLPDCRVNSLVDALAGAASAAARIRPSTIEEISRLFGRQLYHKDIADFATTVEELTNYQSDADDASAPGLLQHFPCWVASDPAQEMEITPSFWSSTAPTQTNALTVRLPRVYYKISSERGKLFERLRRACVKGDTESAIRLTHAYKNLDHGDSQRPLEPCVSAAASHDRAGILAYLLNVYPEFLPVDVIVNTECLASFQLLLDYGWDVNKTLCRLRPPPLGSLIHNEYCVRWLLDHGADPNARGDWDITPLSAAVVKAPSSVIRLLVNGGGDVRKGQLLHFAATRLDDTIAIIDWLLTLGLSAQAIFYANDARSWMENGRFGMGTPLHIAAERGLDKIVCFLLESGVDPDLLDTMGRSARQLAQENGRADMFRDI